MRPPIWPLVIGVTGASVSAVVIRSIRARHAAPADHPTEPPSDLGQMVADIVHNTALHSIEQALHNPDMPVEAINGLREAAFRLRAFLDNAGGDNPGWPLTDSLSAALAPLQTNGFAVELLCSVGPLPRAIVSAVTVATHAAAANAQRHALVDRVQVTARQRPDGALVVTVRDHGIGFDTTRPGGYGLREAMGQVMQDAGGSLIVRSGGSFDGTLVLLQFPAVHTAIDRRVEPTR